MIGSRKGMAIFLILFLLLGAYGAAAEDHHSEGEDPGHPSNTSNISERAHSAVNFFGFVIAIVLVYYALKSISVYGGATGKAMKVNAFGASLLVLKLLFDTFEHTIGIDLLGWAPGHWHAVIHNLLLVIPLLLLAYGFKGLHDVME